MRRDWLFLTSRQHSSDMMQVLPAVWMMMMMRFILGQWVSLASHADHEIIVEQKEKGSKKKKKKVDMWAYCAYPCSLLNIPILTWLWLWNSREPTWEVSIFSWLNYIQEARIIEPWDLTQKQNPEDSGDVDPKDKWMFIPKEKGYLSICMIVMCVCVCVPA